MEKIGKKKAVFRVSFSIHSCTKEDHEVMCTQLEFLLRMLKEQISYMTDGAPHDGIAAIAQVNGVRRMAR